MDKCSYGEGADAVRGSTFMQHLAYVANRRDVWYAARGIEE